ncbi:MAG TPA: iron-sulfur cluster assembly protein [Propionibacteriaceae bacterium]|nr:iron-sulfur cluster assembly protein [Propionibacteriaceae bacterium]
MMTTQEQIFQALGSVYDTCSVFNGTRLDIVEMGLVHDVEQDEGKVRVRLLLTDLMCLYLFEMRSQIIDVLSALPGVESVEVEPVSGKLWWPERMAPEARDRLERRRRARLAQLGLTPAGSVDS